ncbi:MAG: hypothetical protein GY718_19700, partial [Lentisphaerae bacterium]|nr:hypothetical protein [Lentisphaerota bacterium]
MVGGTITTRRSYVYTPLDAEIGTDIFFVVKARLRRAVVSSNELTINPSTVDPTDELANIDNMVYSGDFDEPRDWEGVGGDFDIATGLSGTSGSSTQLLPSSASGTWGVTANTFDGDDATVGTETVTTAGEGTQSITYSFAAATKTGYARVRMASGGQRGRLICYYTLNDSDYVRFGTAAEYADNFQSIVFNGQVMANFKIRVTGRSGLSGSPPTPVDVAHSIYSVSFEETATIVAPYALIADNICTLVPSSADTDVVTKIVDNATGTEYTAATFVDADFTADWQLHRVFWTATADLEGDLSIRIEAGDTFVLRPFPGIEPNQTEVAVISG